MLRGRLIYDEIFKHLALIEILTFSETCKEHYRIVSISPVFKFKNTEYASFSLNKIFNALRADTREILKPLLYLLSFIENEQWQENLKIFYTFMIELQKRIQTFDRENIKDLLLPLMIEQKQKKFISNFYQITQNDLLRQIKDYLGHFNEPVDAKNFLKLSQKRELELKIFKTYHEKLPPFLQDLTEINFIPEAKDVKMLTPYGLLALRISAWTLLAASATSLMTGLARCAHIFTLDYSVSPGCFAPYRNNLTVPINATDTFAEAAFQDNYMLILLRINYFFLTTAILPLIISLKYRQEIIKQARNAYSLFRVNKPAKDVIIEIPVEELEVAEMDIEDVQDKKSGCCMIL